MRPDRISGGASLATARWLASRRASLFAYVALSQAFSLKERAIVGSERLTARGSQASALATKEG